MWAEDPKKLILEAKQGNQKAFGSLYELFYLPIYRYLYFRTKNKNDAEDLAQTVFLKVYKSLDSFQIQEISPLAYFFTVARNSLIDFYRKDKNLTLGEEYLDLGAGQEEKEDDFWRKKETAEIVHEAIKILPKETGEVMVLRYVNDLSNKDIAKITNKKEDAIRQLQSRGLKTLREHFKKNNLL